MDDVALQFACEQVAERLRDARRVLWITGAGISADSGLPTYRGIGGLYDSDGTEDGVPIEVALSGLMFRIQPALTWKYVAQIEATCREAKPNRAHEVIAASEARHPHVTTLTQNVDGLHREAGSRSVIDIHGDVYDLSCTECGDRRRVQSYAQIEIPPGCGACGGLVRPLVVLFGEMLPADKVKQLDRELQQGFDVVVSIGTTSVFPYIAEPVLRANEWGALSVEVNPGRSEVSDLVDVRIQRGAAEALDMLEPLL